MKKCKKESKEVKSPVEEILQKRRKEKPLRIFQITIPHIWR